MISNVCNRTELMRALKWNCQKIEAVKENLNHGYLNLKELDDLAIACNRVSYLSQELIRERNLQLVAEAQKKLGDSGLQWE
jgi:hypothetical protein